MKKIIDYEIIATSSFVGVNEIVNRMIDEGWQPYGIPWDMRMGPEVYFSAQAMVKYKDE